MHRISVSNILFFIIVVIIGAILAAITPKYFGGPRILSVLAFLIGQIGMSFIPVIALYPKASPIQAVILASVYFLTTFIICFGAWGINSYGFPGTYAFMWKNREFLINTHSLFVANIASLAALILNFRLVYDEELTKELRGKSPKFKKRPKFSDFQKPLLNRPQKEGTSKFQTKQERESYRSKSTVESGFEDDFGKPFEFEPELEISTENLPEESQGKLFSPEIKEKPQESDFFEEEEIIGEHTRESRIKDPFSSLSKERTETFDSPFPEKPKPIQLSATPPSDIKNDLAAIFEQYSSLNAVKKLTGSKTTKKYQKDEETKTRKSTKGSKEVSQISVHIEGEDIHEASFRQISESEKLEEIKEELKKELQEKILENVNQGTQKIEETIQKTANTKEEIIQSIKSIKEELKKEFIEEGLQQIYNLEEKIRKETSKETVEESQEEIKMLQDSLADLNKSPNIIGTMFLNKQGKLIAENWPKKQVLHKEAKNKIASLFNSANNHINKTKQGNLCHLLLESENGTLILAEMENKILTVYTEGTGEVFSGQILRALSAIEEE